MEQKFEGTPKAEISLQGRKVSRGPVSNDWGSRLQWKVSRDGEVLATPLARVVEEYEHQDQVKGTYEIVLQMWKYVNYKKDKDGEFTESSYVDISNKVTYTI